MSVCEFLPSIIVEAVRKGGDERGGRGRSSLKRRMMQVQLHTSRQSRAACQILIIPPTRSRMASILLIARISTCFASPL